MEHCDWSCAHNVAALWHLNFGRGPGNKTDSDADSERAFFRGETLCLKTVTMHTGLRTVTRDISNTCNANGAVQLELNGAEWSTAVGAVRTGVRAISHELCRTTCLLPGTPDHF
jgi:hypothetical protein